MIRYHKILIMGKVSHKLLIGFSCIIIFLIPVAVCGCSDISLQAEDVVAEYFRAVKDNDFTAAAGLYSEDFLKNYSPAEIYQSLENVYALTGSLESYSSTTENPYPPGTWISRPASNSWTGRYKVEYSGMTTIETFIVLKIEPHEYKIYRHDIYTGDTYEEIFPEVSILER